MNGDPFLVGFDSLFPNQNSSTAPTTWEEDTDQGAQQGISSASGPMLTLTKRSNNQPFLPGGAVNPAAEPNPVCLVVRNIRVAPGVNRQLSSSVLGGGVVGGNFTGGSQEPSSREPVWSPSLSLLGYVRVQLVNMATKTRHLTETLEVTADASLDRLFLAISQAYLEHPDLRRPLYSNERESQGELPEPSTETRYRANALAEVLADAMERALVHRERDFSDSADLLKSWTEDSFKYGAHLRNWFSGNSEWYTYRLRAIVEAVDA